MTNVIPYSPALPLDLSHAPQRVETEPVSVRNVLGVILNRAPMALAVAVFLFLAVMLAVAHRTPQYQANASVMIEPRRENMARPESATPMLPPDTGAIDTQVEMLRSPALAADVVRRLKLYNDPEFAPGVKAPLASEPS